MSLLWTKFIGFIKKLIRQNPQFTKDLFSLGTASAITFLLITPIGILAGRFLGPAEYGKYHLIYSIAQFFLVFMLFGLHAAFIQQYSQAKEFQKEKLKKAFFSLQILLVLLTSLFFLVLAPFLAKFFKVEKSIIFYAILFCILLTLYNAVRAFLQAKKKFKRFALAELIRGAISLSFFGALLVLFHLKNFLLPLIAFIVAVSYTHLTLPTKA